MKQKLKDFFIEKKELLIFLGVLLAVFGLVVGITSLNSPSEVALTVPSTTTTKAPPSTTTTTINPATIEKMVLPISCDHVVVREYFDPSASLEERIKATIFTGTAYINSFGVSYQSSDAKEFDVVSVLSGTVSKVEETEEYGIVIAIEHLDGVVTEYQSLSSATVSAGDHVDKGMKIGVAGTSLIDQEAGTHVHFLVYKSQSLINPKDAYGKLTNEIAVVNEK